MKILNSLFFKSGTVNFTCLLFIFFTTSAHANTTLAPSGEEVQFKYKTYFYSHLLDSETYSRLSPSEKKEFSLEAAEDHFKHLFGIFQSLEFAETQGVPTEVVLGTGAPLLPVKIQILSHKNDPEKEAIQITYQIEGRLLVHKKAAQKWLKKKTLTLPLLVDLPSIYNDLDTWNKKWKKCTDSHYDSPEDFFYFNNPFRELKPCEELRSSPLSQNVEIQISPLLTPEQYKKKAETSFIPLESLLSANGNGKWFTLYFIQGYAEDFQNEYDEGYSLFNQLQDKLIQNFGFLEITNIQEFRNLVGEDYPLQLEVSLQAPEQGRYIRTYLGEVKNKEGKSIPTIIRSILTDTGFDGRKITFAKFWKEAWEQGDFISYNGHSGLGGHMSQANLMDLYDATGIEPIRFNKRKTQVAFMDSCSSYSYYTNEYKDSQPNAHILSNALASYFATSPQITDVFLNQFLKKTSSKTDRKWIDFLKETESAMIELDEEGDPLYEGGHPSYLINLKD